MQHIKIQAPEPSGSEEDFKYFSEYFYGSNQGPPLAGHLVPGAAI